MRTAASVVLGARSMVGRGVDILYVVVGVWINAVVSNG
jgi:hypothetical protein